MEEMKLLEVYWSAIYKIKHGKRLIILKVFRNNKGYSAYAFYETDPEGCEKGVHPHTEYKAIQVAIKKLKEKRREHLRCV